MSEKKRLLKHFLQCSIRFGYTYLIRWSFFEIQCDGCAGWCRQTHEEGSRCQSKGTKLVIAFLMCLD